MEPAEDKKALGEEETPFLGALLRALPSVGVELPLLVGAPLALSARSSSLTGRTTPRSMPSLWVRSGCVIPAAAALSLSSSVKDEKEGGGSFPVGRRYPGEQNRGKKKSSKTS